MNTNKHKTAQLVKDPKGKFQEWEEMLVGKDIHSIRNQIYDMLWDCAFFHCINESRRYAAKDDKGGIKQNRMIHYFINQSFFKTQLLSIRRLIDKDFDRIRKGRQCTVYSLYNLIEDIKKYSAILSRKNILAFHNLPYDYKKARADFDNNTDWTQGTVFEPNEIGHSEGIHRQIDSATGITTDKRSPDDPVLNDNSFKCFRDWLENSQELYDYVNNYIAHSATPESRKVISDEIEGALGKVLNAHKIICETASFVGNKILFCGFGYVLPIPRYGPFDQFDVFEYLDEPIASKETIEKTRQVWEKYRRETEQWCKY